MKTKFLFLLLSVCCLAANADVNVINIMDLGAKNDGSEDVSALINANTEKGTIYLPAGLYRVDAPLRLMNPLRGEGYVRTNVVKPSSTWLISNIDCADSSVGVVEYTEAVGVNVENLNIQCKSAEDGIRIKPCKQKTLTLISKVGVYNLGGCGIRVEGNGSRPVFVEDITIFGAANHPLGSIGLIIEPNDCRLSNIEVMGARVGMEVRGGYAYGANMHLWTGNMSGKDDGVWWKGTRGIVLSRGGSFVGSQIYPDTSYYLFEQKAGNSGSFDISGFLYYDDGSEKGCEDKTGALFHAEPGATPNLRIHNGTVAVCGNNEKRYWMNRLYTPGQDIDNITIRTDLKICGENIDVLCISEALPDYFVEYEEGGRCKVADIFNVADQGTVTADIVLDNGASWAANIVKDQKGKVRMRFSPNNSLCKKYKLSYEEADGMLKIYLSAPEGAAVRARFTTRTMCTYFRPVDYGVLRSHSFAYRYKE